MKPGLLAPAELGRLCLLVQRFAPKRVDPLAPFEMPRLTGVAAAAMSKIVTHNLGLVGRIAQKYRPLIAVEDGMQEGAFGLMRAVYSFDPARGYRFSTYALWWIRHTILRAVGNTRTLIRIPIHLRELVMKAVAANEAFVSAHGRMASPEELAAAMKVDVKRIDEAMNVRRLATTLSLDAPAYQFDEVPHAIADFIASDQPGGDDLLERKEAKAEVHRLLRLLPDRERWVLEARFFQQQTLQELGNGVSLSRERMRQIEARALERLRFAVRHGRVPKEEHDRSSRYRLPENNARAVPAPKVAKAPKPITPAKLRERTAALRRLDEQAKPMRCSAVGRRDHGRCSFNALPGGEFCRMHAARVTARERTASTPAAARGKQNLW